MSRALVAGIGNIFLGDDGFGPEVARILASGPLPDGVSVVDFGIRSIQLAYDLLEPYDIVIVVDAVARRGAPGTLYVIEPDSEQEGFADLGADVHGMNLEAAFTMARELGAPQRRLLVVGCEPLDTSEGMGLSAPIQGVVRSAAELVRALLGRELCT